MADTQEAKPSTFAASIKRKVIDTKHLDYRVDYLARLRALYEGGAALLQNKTVMAEIFPKHRQESPKVYAERVKRAIYIAHASEIVDFITASLAADPIMMSLLGDKVPDDWYSVFAEDVSAPGGDRLPLSSLAREQATEMLICRTAWTRVDMPKAGEFESLGEQVRAGALDAYTVPVQAETVINWKELGTRELEWVVLYDCDQPQAQWNAERDTIVDTWTVWTRTGWAKYQLKRPVGEKIDEDAMATRIDEGAHTFERVPLVRTSVPKGLWAMDTLESPAREHLNKRSALAWAEFQSLLPELYEFKGPEESSEPIAGSQEDAGRATNQARGPGYVQERGHQDRAEWVGPSPEPFKEARLSLNELRDDMHRVMHMMAMAVSQNSTALGRSAASKKEDRSTTNVVLTALGQYIREHMIGVYTMVSRGRGDADLIGQWQVEGAAEFESDSGDAILDRAAKFALAPVHSAIFNQDVELDCAKAWYGDRGTDQEKLDKIEAQIRAYVPPVPPTAPVKAKKEGEVTPPEVDGSAEEMMASKKAQDESDA